MLNFPIARQFFADHCESRLILMPYPDADGLAGAAMLQRGLCGSAQIHCAEKGTSLSEKTVRKQLADMGAEALVLIDQTAPLDSLLPGMPTLIIDHHAESGHTHACTLNSCDTPLMTSTHLCFSLLHEPDELLWLAALGIIGDYGMSAPSPLLKKAKARYSQTALLETVALINASRRSSRYNWDTASNLLQQANDPAQIAHAELPGVSTLREDRQEVAAEVKRARKARPCLADPWAIIPFASPCAIDDLLAASYVNRLQHHFIIAANFGYRPGYVHLSLHAALPADLLGEFNAIVPPALSATNGHPYLTTTNGAIPHHDFLLLLTHMGFSPQETLEFDRTRNRMN